MLYKLLFSGVLFSALALACSSSTTNSTSSPGTSSVSCADFCSKIESLCGQALPDCANSCETNSSASQRSCVVSSSSCQTALACPKDSGGADGGTSGGDSGGTHACDGTKYCSDSNTSSVCTNGVTKSQPCNGKTCAGGRCGACTSANDCKSIGYRCKCADGSEQTGSVDGSCGDSQGSQKWCSHPNIDQSVCNGHGGFDSTFGYLSTGCISIVDP